MTTLALLSLVLVYAWDLHRKWRQQEEEVSRIITSYQFRRAVFRLGIGGSKRVQREIEDYCYWTDDPIPKNEPFDLIRDFPEYKQFFTGEEILTIEQAHDLVSEVMSKSRLTMEEAAAVLSKTFLDYKEDKK